MKARFLYVFGFVTVTLLAISAGPASANAVGPYYATPSWDQTLPAATRFVALSNFASAAVLDRETGLIWERTPSATRQLWESAQVVCNTLVVGNRKGWRLPTLQELASLVDPTVATPGPTLPAGHPFTAMGDIYWSATSAVDGQQRVVRELLQRQRDLRR